jgi:hypothetical protein
MLKILNKLEIDKNFLKDIYKTPTANIILNSEMGYTHWLISRQEILLKSLPIRSLTCKPSGKLQYK